MTLDGILIGSNRMTGDSDLNDGKETLIVLAAAVAASRDGASDVALTEVDDHVIRLSLLGSTSFWHRHPDSDQAHVVIDGLVLIETANERVEMVPRQLYTVPAGVEHAVRALKDRATVLTFERLTATTDPVSSSSARRDT